MKILFDTDVIVDLCLQRSPVYEETLQALDLCRSGNVTIYLYVGSIQSILRALSDSLAKQDCVESGNLEQHDIYARKAAQLLGKHIHGFLLHSALSDDWNGFQDDKPETVQLQRATRRLGEDALLITGNEKLLESFPQAIRPSEFISRMSSGAGDSTPLQFCDLSRQLDSFRPEMEKAVLNVVESAAYINGPAVGALEKELSDFLGGGVESIACSSGTDALLIALMALGVQPGDEVIVPDFTFIATGEVVSLLGAIPVFCDVDPETFNIKPELLEGLINKKTAGIMPVSIFGQCADFDAIQTIADKHGIWVLEDGAQSFGAEYKGRKSCTITQVSTTSFYPAKPLGCYGDGGAIFTSDTNLAGRIRVILNHGQDKRYHHSRIGINGRMDTVQAAIVSVKLKTFAEEIELRNQIAHHYSNLLAHIVKTPVVREGNTSVWAQYTVLHDSREAIRSSLADAGIPTTVHYPVPLHRQQAFSYLWEQKGGDRPLPSCPVTESLSERVFSLPMHSFLSKKEAERVAIEISRSLEQ